MLMNSFYLQLCHRHFVNIGFIEKNVKVSMLNVFKYDAGS